MSVEWSPDDQFLIVKTERVNANRGNKTENLLTILDADAEFVKLLSIQLDSVSDIAFTADNILFAVASVSSDGKSGLISIFNTLPWERDEEPEETRSGLLHLVPTKREWGRVTHISFTDYGELFAAGYQSGDIEIYSTVDWMVRQTFKFHNSLSTCTFTVHDELLFAAGQIDVDVSPTQTPQDYFGYTSHAKISP